MAKVTHGLSGLRTKVRARGVEQTIDRRSSGWREMSAFKEALASDLGGRETLSIQETTLVDLAARTFLLLNHVDGYLFGLDSPLVGRGKSKKLAPVVKERGELARHLESIFGRLGLKKREKNVTDLASYLSKRYGSEKPPSIDTEDQTTDDDAKVASGGSDEG